MNKIEELTVKRQKQLEIKKIADAEIERIDRVIAAFQLLVDEDIVPQSDKTDGIIEHASHTSKRGRKQVEERNVKVRMAIEQRGKLSFSAPGIGRLAGLNTRTVKRAIDAMIANGQLMVVKPGYKRRATRYKAVQME